MSTEFHQELTLPISFASFSQTLHDPEYWQQRILINNDQGRINEIDIADELVSISSIIVISAEDLPSVIQNVKPQGLEIARAEKWTFSADTILSNFTLQVIDAPAELKGNSTIRPATSDSINYDFQGKAEVNIPIFGKKIETGVVEGIDAVVSKEREFTVTWVNEHQ